MTKKFKLVLVVVVSLLATGLAVLQGCGKENEPSYSTITGATS